MLPVATTERSALVSAPSREGNQFVGEFGSSDKPKQLCDIVNNLGTLGQIVGNFMAVLLVDVGVNQVVVDTSGNLMLTTHL